MSLILSVFIVATEKGKVKRLVLIILVDYNERYKIDDLSNSSKPRDNKKRKQNSNRKVCKV